MAWVVAVALGAIQPPAHAVTDDDRGPGPLPWRVGGELSFTADAAAFPDSVGHTLEVYVRIPPSTLAGLARENGQDARLKLSVRVRGQYGGHPHEAIQEFAVAPGDTGEGFGKVVVTRFPARPGACRLRVRLDDLISHKRGLVYIGRKVTEFVQVEGELLVPAPQAGREVSDIEFIWADVTGRASPAFERIHGGTQFPTGTAPVAYLPNPERLYGLLAPELRAYFVVRAPAGSERPWRWNARVLNAHGEVVAERDSSGPPGRTLMQRMEIDLSSEPAGGYDLEVKAWQEGDPRSVLRSAHFSVAWQSSSWSRDPGEVADAVHLLLDGGEEEAFGRMQPGEQEQFMEEFWRRRDPSPDTAENEARIAFQARVDFANRTWGRAALGRGMFSDMGRVYIRYGEPDDILKQVIPAGDQTLLQVLAELELAEDRPTGDVVAKGLGGDQRPFEIWIYEERPRAPITSEADAFRATRPYKRLLFLFVDEQGYGDFRLRYTTE